MFHLMFSGVIEVELGWEWINVDEQCIAIKCLESQLNRILKYKG